MPRALRALGLHVPRALCTAVPHVHRGLCALVPRMLRALDSHVLRVLRALVSHVLRTLRALVSPVPRASCALCSTHLTYARALRAPCVSCLVSFMCQYHFSALVCLLHLTFPYLFPTCQFLLELLYS